MGHEGRSEYTRSLHMCHMDSDVHGWDRGVWVGDVETQPDTWVCGSGKRSGLGDTLRRHHSFIQQMIVEHTLCASRGAGCWATQSPPQETPADLVKVVVNAMETDELAHGVRVRVRVRARAYV